MTILLALYLSATQFADWFTTRRNILSGGSENWFTMKAVIDRFGLRGLAVVKMVMGTVPPALFAYLGWTELLAFFCGLYTPIVWQNWRAFK